MKEFTGVFCDGKGDAGWLQLLEDCWLVLDGSGDLCSLMEDCYLPKQDRFDEGTHWRYGFWTQNSYGMVAWLPILPADKLRPLKRSLDLLYEGQGDGVKSDYHGFVGEPGSMPDAVSLDDDGVFFFHLRQGDGDVVRHDCMIESAAADIVFLSEYLLATRDAVEIHCCVRDLERSADFIHSRRDPENGLFRVGPSGNLLAPSYAGTRMEDGTFSWGYHSGVQVTYCAALERLIEVEKLAKRSDKVQQYEARLKQAIEALPQFFTDEGYLVNYIDQNGVSHGVYGADEFGYIQATCNHDAIAFGVFDEETSKKCYAKLKSVKGLWVDGLIRNNYPALDDTYEHWGTKIGGSYLWKYGVWVDGGVWGTNHGRMILAQFRLNEFDDAREGAESMMAEMRKGIAPAIWVASEYPSSGRPNELDSYAVPGAVLRGLWECRYDSEALTIVPHIPEEITWLKQKQPIRFGPREIYIEITNEGNQLSSVELNGDALSYEDGIRIPYELLTEARNDLRIVR